MNVLACHCQEDYVFQFMIQSQVAPHTKSRDAESGAVGTPEVGRCDQYQSCTTTLFTSNFDFLTPDFFWFPLIWSCVSGRYFWLLSTLFLVGFDMPHTSYLFGNETGSVHRTCVFMSIDLMVMKKVPKCRWYDPAKRFQLWSEEPVCWNFSIYWCLTSSSIGKRRGDHCILNV